RAGGGGHEEPRPEDARGLAAQERGEDDRRPDKVGRERRVGEPARDHGAVPRRGRQERRPVQEAGQAGGGVARRDEDGNGGGAVRSGSQEEVAKGRNKAHGAATPRRIFLPETDGFLV